VSAELQGAWVRTCLRRADAPAVIEAASGRVATFAGLAAGAEAWARRHAPGAGRLAGRPVAFSLPNGIQWMETFLALAGLGAAIVPLDAGEPPASIPRFVAELGGGWWWDGQGLREEPGGRRFRDPEIALIKLTSGSTGRPRPLAFTGAQLLADAGQVTATMGIREEDLNYGLIPLGHSYGLGNLTLPLVALGIPLVCGSAPLPQAIADDFAAWRPTVLPSVPAIWSALVRAGLGRGALGSLRLAISAGAPLPPEVAQAFRERFGQSLHAFYGSSETGGIAYDRDGRATLEGGVGAAMEGVQLRTLPGQRLEVASAAVTTYRNRRRAHGLGAWLMPDRAEVAEDGGVRLLGRRGALIKIGGRRVGLAEVEARLRRLAGVRDVWVGAAGSAEPVLGAAVATERSAVELRAELLADTASWKVPKRLVCIAALPVTARGKVDTAMLRAKVFGGAG
jgi:acyl-coenzyme A synthetase/AMP-(fatty) acid ligase